MRLNLLKEFIDTDSAITISVKATYEKADVISLPIQIIIMIVLLHQPFNVSKCNEFAYAGHAKLRRLKLISSSSSHCQKRLSGIKIFPLFKLLPHYFHLYLRFNGLVDHVKIGGHCVALKPKARI